MQPLPVQFACKQMPEDCVQANCVATACAVCRRQTLADWFQIGLLNLQRITWEETSADLLEKIRRYEAVHEIQASMHACAGTRITCRAVMLESSCTGELGKLDVAMGWPEAIMSACVDRTAVVLCRCDTGCLQQKALQWSGRGTAHLDRAGAASCHYTLRLLLD